MQYELFIGDSARKRNLGACRQGEIEQPATFVQGSSFFSDACQPIDKDFRSPGICLRVVEGGAWFSEQVTARNRDRSLVLEYGREGISQPPFSPHSTCLRNSFDRHERGFILTV